MHETPDIVLVGTEGTEGILDFLKRNTKEGYSVEILEPREDDYSFSPTRTAAETVGLLADGLADKTGRAYPEASVIISVAMRAYHDDDSEILDPSTDEELQDLLRYLNKELNQYSVWIGVAVLFPGIRRVSFTFEEYLCSTVFSEKVIRDLFVPKEELARSGPNRLFVEDGYFDTFLSSAETDRELILTRITEQLQGPCMDFTEWFLAPRKNEEKEIFRGDYLV